MSRRGRGRGKTSLDLPADWDLTTKLDNRPSEDFPLYHIPAAEPPTEKEKREVRSYLRLLDDIRQGPLYTKPRMRGRGHPVKTYGEEQFNDLHDNSLKNEVDPFNGVPRYSWRYTQEKHIMPDVSGSQFDKSFFPEELWATLDGKDGSAPRNPAKIGTMRKPSILRDITASGLTSQEKTRMMMEKMKNFADAEDGETGVEAEEEDEDQQEEDEGDYNFEEDDDEMGGDYGAEQYFDNGDGDDDDGGDAGGGDIY